MKRLIFVLLAVVCLSGCNPAFLQGVSEGLSGTYQMNQARQRQQWQEINRQSAMQAQTAALERQARAAERQANAADAKRYGF